MTTLRFKIHRDKERGDLEDYELWEYDEVQAAEKRTNYVVIMMPARSAFIPIDWVLEVQEIKQP